MGIFYGIHNNLYCCVLSVVLTILKIWWLSWFMVFNATFNNISFISWWSVLLGNWRKPPTCRKSLTNFIT